MSTQSAHLALSDQPPVDRYEIPIECLGGATETCLSFSVKVLETAVSYETTLAQVSLHLTPPDKSEPCSIQARKVSIKVANAYHYNPDADVLLVTNINTTPDEVDSWNSLICDQLKLKMDIYDISARGKLETVLPETKVPQPLFGLYQGKIIIMLGNSFSWFERSKRNALDLVDGANFELAMAHGTSMIVSGLKNPLQQMHIPHLLRSKTYSRSLQFITIKKLVKAVIAVKDTTVFFETKFVCSLKGKGNAAHRCMSKANRAAAELLRRLPNVRFTIICTTSGNGPKVEVFPCDTFTDAKFLMTSAELGIRSKHVHAFSLFLCIPFVVRLQMLWDIFSEDSVSLEEQFTAHLIGAVRFDLIIELARFASRSPPWPDKIPEKQILIYLNRLGTFFFFNPNCRFSSSSVDPAIAILGDLILLADCCNGFWPRAMTFGTRRKRLCKTLNGLIDQFLIIHYGGVKESPYHCRYRQYVKIQARALKRGESKNKKLNLLKRVANSIGVQVGSINSLAELVDVEVMGNIVRNAADVDMGKHAEQLKEDLAHAQRQLNQFMA